MFSEIIHRAELEDMQLPVEVSIDHEFGSGERKTELVQLHAIPQLYSLVCSFLIFCTPHFVLILMRGEYAFVMEDHNNLGPTL